MKERQSNGKPAFVERALNMVKTIYKTVLAGDVYLMGGDFNQEEVRQLEKFGNISITARDTQRKVKELRRDIKKFENGKER